MRILILAGAVLLVLTALSAAPAASSRGKCRATLVYRGITYFGLEGSHLGLRTGRAAGVAREPECNDTGAGPQKKYNRVAVRRIVSVRPRVAIARQDVPNIIYLANDRCRGNLRPSALVRCLKRSR